MAVELYVTKKGETTCVALLGEFELEGVEQLQARLERLKDDHPQPTLDLRRVVFVDQAFAERSLMSGA
jgi:anti-anti-sigma regulatory factor